MPAGFRPFEQRHRKGQPNSNQQYNHDGTCGRLRPWTTELNAQDTLNGIGCRQIVADATIKLFNNSRGTIAPGDTSCSDREMMLNTLPAGPKQIRKNWEKNINVHRKSAWNNQKATNPCAICPQVPRSEKTPARKLLAQNLH